MRRFPWLLTFALLVCVATGRTAHAQGEDQVALEAYFRGGAALGRPDDVLRFFDKARDLRGGALLTAPLLDGLLRLGGYVDFGQRQVREVFPVPGTNVREVFTERRWVSELGLACSERLWADGSTTVRVGQQLGYLQSRYRSLDLSHIGNTAGNAQGRRLLRDLPIVSPLQLDPRHWLSARVSLEVHAALWKHVGVVLALELAYQWQPVESVLEGGGASPEGAWDVPVGRHAIHPSARFGFYFGG